MASKLLSLPVIGLIVVAGYVLLKKGGFSVSVTPNPVTNANPLIVNVTVSGAAPGALTFTMTTSPIGQYGTSTWSGTADSTGAASFSVNLGSITSGTQNVTVTDSSGKTATTTFVVS